MIIDEVNVRSARYGSFFKDSSVRLGKDSSMRLGKDSSVRLGKDSSVHLGMKDILCNTSLRETSIHKVMGGGASERSVRKYKRSSEKNTIRNPLKTPVRVLVIDDSVAIQKVMKRWLECNGCVVTSAENGKVGLFLLKEQQFDIAFVDFLMVRDSSQPYYQYS